MSQSSSHYYIAAFYQFIDLKDLPVIKKNLENKAAELNIKGLVIIAAEGFNSTCSASSLDAYNLWKQFILSSFSLTSLFFKESQSQKMPFRRFKVNIRPEIVTTGVPKMTPPIGRNSYLSPSEWQRILKEESDYVLIDTRNSYEYRIGTFVNAVNPNIEKFTDFSKFMEAQNIPKDKKMLIFCTGGIRCEKGILELQDKGYSNVHQLDGGILNYIQEYPNEYFKGECFVFDQRVALTQELKPTTNYQLCPHCGQPGDKKIICKVCDSEQIICIDCSGLEFKNITCSKNCVYQYKMHLTSY